MIDPLKPEQMPANQNALFEILKLLTIHTINVIPTNIEAKKSIIAPILL